MKFFQESQRFLYLSIVSFILVSTSALSLSKSNPDTVVQNFSLKSFFAHGQEGEFPDLPVLSKNSSFPVISSQGALATDLDSGITLYEKNADGELLPASTTKIITALVAMDEYPDEKILEVRNVKIEGQKMGLIEGERISALDLLYGLLVYSANDAAEVFANTFPGGRIKFIEKMNQKAEELHLEKTNFTNPSGLDGNLQYTSARDLMRVSSYAMEVPKFAQIVGTKNITVASVDGKTVHKLTNINKLLGSVEGVSGVKTGWTEIASENLVTLVERKGRKVMIVLLGSQDRFGETKEIIDWIYSNYKWKRIIPS